VTELNVEVRLDPRWIEIPVRDESDLHAWARRAVQDGLRIRRRKEPREIRRILVAGFVEMAEGARRRAFSEDAETMAAYILAPGEDCVPVSVVKLHVLRPEPGTTLERAADDVIMPAEARFGDPIVTDMETAGGQAIKVKQFPIIGVSESDDGQQVYTLFAYLWVGPTPDMFVGLQAWFASPVEAELAEEALDQLATSVNVRLATS
jgi:hypothetical protein